MNLILNTLNDKRLIEMLRKGGVGVIPTDTTYGLVAAATEPEAVARLYGLKSREHKPGTLVAANIEQLVAFGFKARYLKPVEPYWPNPISIIIPTEPGMEYLHVGLFSLPVRIPAYKPLVDLLSKTGPLLTTSANQPGKKPAENIQQAQDYFWDKVDFYVDGGDLADHTPSTIIRIVDDAVEVIREGAIKIDENGQIKQ